MKKFIVFIFFMLSLTFLTGSPSLLSSAYEYNLTEGEAKVISSKCDLYSSISFTSEKVQVDGENISLKYGDIVNVIEILDDFAHIQTSDEIDGYVYKYYLTQNTSQTIYPVFNASIRRTTIIYDDADLKIKSDFEAKKGARVFLFKGFNDKKKSTAVQIVLEDGSPYNGYIKTADIKPDGISGILIAGITIIVASVTIILSLVFIKKVRKNKK